jgi:hypothetical protein
MLISPHCSRCPATVCPNVPSCPCFSGPNGSTSPVTTGPHFHVVSQLSQCNMCTQNMLSHSVFFISFWDVFGTSKGSITKRTLFAVLDSMF